MDDFDLRLELELAHLLDPIVDAPVPRRRRPSPFRALAGGLDAEARDREVTVVSEALPVALAAPVGTPL